MSAQMAGGAPPRYCGHCGAPNAPGAAFCGRCGRPFAAGPVPVAAAAPPLTAGYPYSPASHSHLAASHPRKLHPLGLLLILGGAVVLAAIGLGIAAYAIRPQPVSCTGPQCSTRPPTSNPLPAEATYRSSTYGFTVDYTKDFSPTDSSDSAVGWSGQLTDGTPFNYVFVGDAANGRSPQQVVDDVQSSKFPGAKAAYPADGIPGANLGYTPGYGQVYDVFTGSGQATRERVVIIAAVQGNVAVEMIGEGPWRQSTQSLDDHPNPADVSFVGLGNYMFSVESVRWPGEAAL